jgi:DNA-binding response OmpR family regulator
MTQILLVEDEQHLAIGIKYNLEAEGHRVVLADDGPTALRLCEGDRQGFDLVILDLMLPGMSGYKVCERIRSIDATLPILILSARSLPEDRARGFDLGANQYLNKPFDLDELFSRVNNLLRLPRGPARTTRTARSIQQLQFGSAAVDFLTHQVKVDGKEVKLTPTELRLLKYFAEHSDRVLSRQELLSEVWDLSGEMQTRTVDQYLLRLRKTFEKNPAQPIHFLTVRDMGYRFVADPKAEAAF